MANITGGVDVSKKKTGESWDIDWFLDRGARISNPFITITGNGTFLFSSGFVHEAGLESLGTQPYVRFSYYEPENAIIFDFTEDKKAEGVYTLVLRGKSGKSGSVTCRALFKKKNLDPEQLAGRYAPEKKRIARAGEFWFIDLDKKLEE